MKEILATWNQKLGATKALYEGPVQIALESADVKTVLDECCPEEFAAIKKSLSEYVPTHVLVTVAQLELLIQEASE